MQSRGMIQGNYAITNSSSLSSRDVFEIMRYMKDINPVVHDIDRAAGFCVMLVRRSLAEYLMRKYGYSATEIPNFEEEGYA